DNRGVGKRAATRGHDCPLWDRRVNIELRERPPSTRKHSRNPEKYTQVATNPSSNEPLKRSRYCTRRYNMRVAVPGCGGLSRRKSRKPGGHMAVLLRIAG